VPPVVATEGDLVFRGKAESPLTLFINLICIQPTGASDMHKMTLNSFLRVDAM
jgi:hypothetical protein